MQQPPTAPPPSYDNVAKTQPQPAGYNPQYGGGPSGYNPQPVVAQPYGTQPQYNAGVVQPSYTGYPAAGHTVVMGNAGAAVGLSRNPCHFKCTHCGADIVTEVKYVNGSAVCMCMLFCILMGCWCGCCLMPLCSQTYKDAEHHCPNCKAHLGTCPGGAGVRVNQY